MNENWTKNYKKAAQGNDYVKLNAGLMKVKDLDNYLSSFPSNLLSFNKTGEFTYYKQLPGMNYNPPELGENITSLGQTESEKKQLKEVFHKWINISNSFINSSKMMVFIKNSPICVYHKSFLSISLICKMQFFCFTCA